MGSTPVRTQRGSNQAADPVSTDRTATVEQANGAVARKRLRDEKPDRPGALPSGAHRQQQQQLGIRPRSPSGPLSQEPEPELDPETSDSDSNERLLPMANDSSVPISSTERTAFLTEGSSRLKQIRTFIAEFSLRQQHAFGQRTFPSRNRVHSRLARWEQCSCDVGDDRPLSCCRMVDSAHCLVGSFSGRLRKFSVSPSSAVAELQLPSRVSAIDSRADFCIVGCFDGRLVGIAHPTMDIRSSVAVSRQGERLGAVKVHPAVPAVALAASYDASWSMVDLEQEAVAWRQEGHATAVHSLAVYPTGALVASGDLDGVVRISDARTGTTQAVLATAHLGQVLSLEFPETERILLSAGADRLVKVWDMRSLHRELHRFPAHMDIVTCMRSDPASGTLFTSSFDGTCRVWDLTCLSAAASPVLLRQFSTPEKMMGLDLLSTAKDGCAGFVSAHLDRTWRVWAEETLPG